MIAHSGFTRGHLPGSFQEWIAANGGKMTSELYPEYLAAKQAGQAAALAHFTAITPPVPAPAVRPDVPMAMHLEHLEITAKAARNFWFVIGWCCGSAAGALLATYLYHRYG